MQSPELNSYKDVIRMFDTAEELAELMGEPSVTVRQWGNRNSIPPAQWRRVIEAAAKKKIVITMEQLAALAEQKRAAS